VLVDHKGKTKMRITLIAIMLLLFANVGQASEDTNLYFRKILSGFEGLCLHNELDSSAIDGIIGIKKDAIALTEQEMKAVTGKTGNFKGYRYKENKRLTVLIYNNDACGIAIQDKNIKAFKKMLESSFKLKPQYRSDEGFQTTEMYSFRNNSLYSGGLLMLVYTNDMGVDAAILLNYLPERIVKTLISK
jgi:hypothetical protein